MIWSLYAMLGLPKYYEVCRDLIREVYELFDKPRFIHLAMDEEESPLCIRYMERSVPTAEAGFDIVPCASICFGCMYNPNDVVEYFELNALREHMAGYMVAP